MLKELQYKVHNGTNICKMTEGGRDIAQTAFYGNTGHMFNDAKEILTKMNGYDFMAERLKLIASMTSQISPEVMAVITETLELARVK